MNEGLTNLNLLYFLQETISHFKKSIKSDTIWGVKQLTKLQTRKKTTLTGWLLSYYFLKFFYDEGIFCG